MKIIKETDRDVVRLVTYHGICDACATPLDYPDDLIVVIVHKGKDMDILVPVDILCCPSCFKTIETIKIYHNLEVSKELHGQDHKI